MGVADRFSAAEDALARGAQVVSYDVAQRRWTGQLVEPQRVLGQIATTTEQIAGSCSQQGKSSSGRFEV
jgi:uncharacterized protein YukE